DSTPWAWASEPGATKNNTRRAKRFVSERMFFLSQKDLAESKCPAPAHAGALRQTFNRVVYCGRRIDPGTTNRPHNTVVAGEVKRQRNRSMCGQLKNQFHMPARSSPLLKRKNSRFSEKQR